MTLCDKTSCQVSTTLPLNFLELEESKRSQRVGVMSALQNEARITVASSDHTRTLLYTVRGVPSFASLGRLEEKTLRREGQ